MLSLKATVSSQSVKHGALEIDLIFVDDSPPLSSVLTELLQRVEAAEGGSGLGELLKRVTLTCASLPRAPCASPSIVLAGQ